MSKASINTYIDSQFPNNTQQLIKPINSRNVSKKIVLETINTKDGGFETEKQVGYKTEDVVVSDPKAWITKKYLEDYGGALPYNEEIECDGEITSYTITHNKNTFSPIVSLYFLVLDTGVGYDAWQPLDITQGIYVNATDPDTLFFNTMVYHGNDNGFKYKIRII